MLKPSDLDPKSLRLQAMRRARSALERDFIAREDKGRARYIKKYFEVEVDDPLNYHLTINTSLVSYDAAAELIVTAASSMTKPG